MLRFMVVRKASVEPEVMYSTGELDLARLFYAREKQGLLLAGYKVSDNPSFSDKSSIPLNDNDIYRGDIESLAWFGHNGSGVMAIKVSDI